MNRKKIILKNKELNNIIGLAPMAGISDLAFREVCKEFGTGFCITEMISAKALTMNDEKTKELLTLSDKERPTGIQLFGNDTDIMSNAVKILENISPDFIDINLGCPAPKIIKSHSGSYLLDKPFQIEKILSAVKKVSNVPVSAKFRIGRTNGNININETAKAAESGGADFITIHGRTAEQMYAPPVNYEEIKKVKLNINIPVIVNGNIVDYKSAKNILEYTGCDYAMVGRAAIGNPWIFKEINEYLEFGTIPKPISIEERMSVMIKHIEIMCKYKGEYSGILQARTHCAHYVRGLNGATKYRRLLTTVRSLEELKLISEQIISEQYKS
ncbi:MAG: tRNA dihydrouridine synthase DusB [Candidatus Fimenecus sp.]